MTGIICNRTVLNEIRQSVLYNYKEIVKILADDAMKQTNLLDAEFSIVIEEQTEGSPPYRVGFKARIDLIKKL